VIRKAGFGLLGLGLLIIVWLALTLLYGDPVTAWYTRHKQQALSQRLDVIDTQWAAKLAVRPAALSRHITAVSMGSEARDAALARASRLRAAAIAFRRSLGEGQPIGRILIPRIHLKMVVVQGTSEGDLSKGPGHYDSASGQNTGLPGMGGVIGIAGHRTTFLQPFRHIDDLRPGDKIYLEMPYGTFSYTVYAHRVVASTDWTILHRRPFEKLVLSACHPLYSATHRWVVFARLESHGAPVATGA